jgi:hypothetical protein
MKRDLKYCGCGAVTNQIKEANGSRKEMHPYEDRSLSYEYQMIFILIAFHKP